MDKDTTGLFNPKFVTCVGSKDRNLDDEKFWVDFDRNYFLVPNAALVTCLKSHIWHCKTIANTTLGYLQSLKKTETSNKTSVESVTFSLKETSKFCENACSTLGSLDTLLNKDPFSYFTSDTKPSSTDSLLEYDNIGEYFNPLENAKHDSRQRLPGIHPGSLPDGIHLTFYCPDNTSLDIPQHEDASTPSLLNDYLSINEIPDIIYGPMPAWSRFSTPRFNKGRIIGKAVDLGSNAVSKVGLQVSDPLWNTGNDFKITEIARGSSDLLNLHCMTDAQTPCQVEYSPSLFTFTEHKPVGICKRCLGMPKIACAWCKTNSTDGLGGITFGSRDNTEFKYQMSYNWLDINKMRALMKEEENIENVPEIQQEDPPKSICPNDNDIRAVLYNYLQTLQGISDSFGVLLDRVQKERRPDYNRCSEIETKMLQDYLDQYHSKTFDSRYAYTVQLQSIDVMRLRLSCKNSARFPAKWTDHAICNICGSDEDWDDDPILFCDCCFIPMHFCCLGYKAGTLSEVTKHNLRRHDQSSNNDLEDDDEWLCPGCNYLMNQIPFIKEETAFKIARAVTGPKNKQQMDYLCQNKHPWGPQDSNVELPYIVGFEHDVLSERTISVLFPADPGDCSNEELTSLIIQGGNTPICIAVVNSSGQYPFGDLSRFRVEYLKNNELCLCDYNRFKAALVGTCDDFSETFIKALEYQDLRILSSLVSHVAKEDLHLQRTRAIMEHVPIYATQLIKKQKTIPLKPVRNSCRLNIEGIDFNREDIYSISCKNPQKKLVMSVKCGTGLFINLRIPVCIFCGFDAYYPGGGPIKRTSNAGTWGHVKCALGLDVTITEKEIDYSTFVPKIKALKCIICQHWSTAIVQCSHSTCCRAFHVPCAASSSGCLFSWDTSGKPDILCPLHASGLAPTVVLRKLQHKVQYKHARKLQNFESSIDGLSTKDHVYLEHLLSPNYRNIATMIEKLLDLKVGKLFPFAFMGDTNPKEKIETLNVDQKCRVTNVDSSHCIWCILKIDAQGHYKHIVDDKTPSLALVGSILFPNFKNAKTRVKSTPTTNSHGENTTNGMVAGLLESKASVDAKILKLISNDSIGGRRLVSEGESNTFRRCMGAFLRIVNMVHGPDIRDGVLENFVQLQHHIEEIQEIDRKRLYSNIKTNPSQETVDTDKPAEPMVTPPCENILKLLGDLNQSVLMGLNAECFPPIILRNFYPPRQATDLDPTPSYSPMSIAICQGCLEFKVSERNDLNSQMRRTLEDFDYKICTLCHVRACSECLRCCKGVLDPEGVLFTCQRCMDIMSDGHMPLLCCILCSRFDGLMMKIPLGNVSFLSHWANEYNGNAYVHLVCLDWLCCTRSCDGLRKFPKSVLDRSCSYCGIHSGATLNCVYSGCNVRFHASCGALVGCRVETGKRAENVGIPRKIYCLRHTLNYIAKTSPTDRKFLLGPSYLYEIAISPNMLLNTFIKGIYTSHNCTNTRPKWEAKRSQSAIKRKATESYNQKLSLLSNLDYINLGLVPCKPRPPNAFDDHRIITEHIARDRLIQAMNYAAINGIAAQNDIDKREIKFIISMLKQGQLKPIPGSKRGRKPKSLDGSRDFDLRIFRPDAKWRLLLPSMLLRLF
ncbi:bifunctional Zinc finger [Babesia duncani]|uniref:Bifunctional Zinc finger n=1 Tax=Babesia duncani TaxID=323732 RepID=A0AAD9UNJ6_9APIC|nr:bifunctional Zinc finger [Babesia duncani]